MSAHLPTPTWRRIHGLVGAALLGWAIFIGELAIPSAYAAWTPGNDDWWDQIVSLVVIGGLFGIPVAVVACIVVGLPLWSLAERRGMFGLRPAMLCGGLAAFVIAAASTGITLLTLTPGGSFGDGGGWLIKDGQLTAHGWAREIWQAAQFIVAGALAGPVAARIGRGKASQQLAG